MRLDAKTSGVRGTFRRADNGQPVRWVRWYDDQTQEWEAFRVDPQLAKQRGIPLATLLYRGRCPLVFTPTNPVEAKPLGRQASSTPLEEIRREVLKGGEVKAEPILFVPGMPTPECEEPLCHRPAVWSVAVEQLVEPERGADGKLYERAVTVAAACFCDRHYRNPRQISERGVENEIVVTARPQW